MTSNYICRDLMIFTGYSYPLMIFIVLQLVCCSKAAVIGRRGFKGELNVFHFVMSSASTCFASQLISLEY